MSIKKTSSDSPLWASTASSSTEPSFLTSGLRRIINDYSIGKSTSESCSPMSKEEDLSLKAIEAMADSKIRSENIEIQHGNVDATNKPCIMILQRRPKTIKEVDELRGRYLLFQERYVQRTEKSRRLDLLSRMMTAKDGRKVIVLTGMITDVVGYTNHPENRPERICLTSPAVYDFSSARPKVVDSHIWLKTSQLDTDLMDIDFKDESLAKEKFNKYSYLDMGRLSLMFGDTVYLWAEVQGYQSKAGSRRMGIGSWFPMESQLKYVLEGVDGSMRNMRVNSNMRSGVHILQLDWTGDSVSKEWASADEVEQERNRLLAPALELDESKLIMSKRPVHG